MYVGHIPHGFFEKQMHEYFSQFGKVNRVKLSRSNKVMTVPLYVTDSVVRILTSDFVAHVYDIRYANI